MAIVNMQTRLATGCCLGSGSQKFRKSNMAKIKIYEPGKEPGFTHKQGQYLAFIYHYTKIHRVPPAEADLQDFFRTTPSSVHQMIVRLDELGLISRIPGVARTIKVLVPPERLPPLE